MIKKSLNYNEDLLLEVNTFFQSSLHYQSLLSLYYVVYTIFPPIFSLISCKLSNINKYYQILTKKTHF